MDPHMTQEDLDLMKLQPLAHRHLRQNLSPPTIQPPKKKKLVNFRLSIRRPIDGHEPIKCQGIVKGNSFVHNVPIKEELEEDRYKAGNEDKINGNQNNMIKPKVSVSPRSPMESKVSTPVNGNIPTRPQIPETHRPCLNQTSTANRNNINNNNNNNHNNNMNQNQRTRECVPLTTRSPSTTSTTSPWMKVKNRASNESVRRNSLFNVVNVVVNKRRGTPAPSIWTPSVPRSQPTPRPRNWKEQEEAGSGFYVFSFVSNTIQGKTKQQMKQKKFQISPYYQESQSPRQRKKQVEFYGKQYTQWLTDIIQHQSFQKGLIMKGLEIGVQFPVVHMSPVLNDNNSKYFPESSSSTNHFGFGSEAIFTHGVYEEVVSWVPELLVTCPSDPSQWARCYIVIGFKTLDGEFSGVESHWREWTGAMYIYFNISDDLGLKRLSFYRRRSRHHTGLFTYIVVVEVDTVTKENCLYLLDFVYRMRMKSMGGYISVYQEYPPNIAKVETPILSSTTAGQFDTSLLDLKKINI